jgi:hypothetical protein
MDLQMIDWTVNFFYLFNFLMFFEGFIDFFFKIITLLK